MSKHYRARLLAIAAVLALVLLFTPSAAVSAQSKTLEWHTWDANIQINTDGTFRVQETYEI